MLSNKELEKKTKAQLINDVKALQGSLVQAGEIHKELTIRLGEAEKQTQRLEGKIEIKDKARMEEDRDIISVCSRNKILEARVDDLVNDALLAVQDIEALERTQDRLISIIENLTREQTNVTI